MSELMINAIALSSDGKFIASAGQIANDYGTSAIFRLSTSIHNNDDYREYMFNVHDVRIFRFATFTAIHVYKDQFILVGQAVDVVCRDRILFVIIINTDMKVLDIVELPTDSYSSMFETQKIVFIPGAKRQIVIYDVDSKDKIARAHLVDLDDKMT